MVAPVALIAHWSEAFGGCVYAVCKKYIRWHFTYAVIGSVKQLGIKNSDLKRFKARSKNH